jgi:hypothetical protein
VTCRPSLAGEQDQDYECGDEKTQLFCPRGRDDQPLGSADVRTFAGGEATQPAVERSLRTSASSAGMSCRAAAMKSRSTTEAGRIPPASARDTYMSGSSSRSLTRMKSSPPQWSRPSTNAFHGPGEAARQRASIASSSSSSSTTSSMTRSHRTSAYAADGVLLDFPAAASRFCYGPLVIGGQVGSGFVTRMTGHGVLLPSSGGQYTSNRRASASRDACSLAATRSNWRSSTRPPKRGVDHLK